MTSHASLLPIAVGAVEVATNIVRTARPGALAEKSDRDMVSDVDVAVERAVRGYLHERTPAIGFLGEEEGRKGDLSEDLIWILDPIDGTANFVRGLPMCAVSLALVSRRTPVLGIITLPFLQEQYVALTGEGAHEGTRRLRASSTIDLRNAVVAMGDYAVGSNAESRNRLRVAITQHLARRAQRVRMLGSAAVDLAWTAAGKLDASIMLSNKPWDTAAGVVIAREAGARILDRDGSPHTFDSTATLAAAPALAGDLLMLIRDAERASKTEQTSN